MLKEWPELITLLARIFTKSCLLCGRKFRFFSAKYQIEKGFICSYCFEKMREENEKAKEKNKKTMQEYIQKYLSNKDAKFQQRIKELFLERETCGLQAHSLETWREKCRTCLNNLKTVQKGKSIDDVISLKDTAESYLIILDDLEKFFKLFKNKGINADYFEILSIFNDIITNQYDTAINNMANSMYEIISKRLGANISKEGPWVQATNATP